MWNEYCLIFNMMKQESKQNLAKSDFYVKILMKSLDFSEKKIKKLH